MKREEEIKQVAENYASQMCKNCSAMLYCEEKNKKCVERREQENVYVDGAKWADKHPKNVWHDVSEEPRCEELLLGEDSDGFSIYRWCGQEDNWEAFVNATGLSRWAYIADLLS